MTASFTLSALDRQPIESAHDGSLPDAQALFDTIAGEAQTDPALALVRLHEAVARHALDFLGHDLAQTAQGWSRPPFLDPLASEDRALRGQVSGAVLTIAGRQRLYGSGPQDGAFPALVLDPDPSKGGYVATFDLGAYRNTGAPIFDRPGFHIDEIEIGDPLVVRSFEPVRPDELRAALDRASLLEELLHAALDYGLLQAFCGAAHTHITTRTRPWQGQSLAKATDDPHLVRRYGEYVATRHALGGLMAEARDAVQDPNAPDEARQAVAAARGFAVLAGKTLINGTIELLGASATSDRYGFDLFWRDFTAHAVAHPPLWSPEQIGRDLVASGKPETAP